MTYQLTDEKTVKQILARHGIVLSKARGQNFLINPTVCPRMAQASGATKADGVLEIGPGVGVLTAELAKVAGKVVTVEVDKGLPPVLAETLADFDNVTVIEGDILKTDIKELLATHFEGMKVMVCANLPYYITTDILMMLLESGIPFASITVMVQKEFAARLCAPVGSRESGAITVGAAYRAKCERIFTVTGGSFLPPPKVDSTVMRLIPYETPPVQVADEKFFFKMIKAGFNQRRKTMVNALSAGMGITKDTVIVALNHCGLSPTVRIEQLNLEQLASLSRELYSIK
ncbi:MAG: ribosomal RNA small subunit methyltransferase A [Clostridia bacterium]|nr:ribosomal RNA small subunit methyltransferase A [Clostridia bacterium]